MRHTIKKGLLAVWGILFSVNVFAQQVVTGIVTDASTQQTLPGVSVYVSGTTQGTATGLDGNFILRINDGESIVFSFVGYKTQTIVFEEQTTLNIALEADIANLEEAVIIGYGSVKKEDLTGSVIAIKAEDKNRGAITSPQQLLQGKVPGLLVVPGGGAPGEGSSLRIRSGSSLNASNDPLIVIDGVPVANDAAPGMRNALATINPNDIETMNILKDASATAIYGSRGSNGVIIITTKKGSKERIKISYASTYSINDPYEKLETLEANEFRQVFTATFGDDATAMQLLNGANGEYTATSTNWQDETLRPVFGTDQTISAAGTVGILPYRVSIGYNNEDGTIETSNYERYTASINLSPSFFNNHLNVSLNLKGTINNNVFADGGAVGAAAFFDPTKPMYNTDGKFNGFWNWQDASGEAVTLAGTNPLSLLYDKQDTGETKRSIGNIQLDYKMHFLPDLKANLNLGYDIAEGKGYNGASVGSFQAAKDSDFKNIGQHNEWKNFRRNTLLDFYLNYEKEISKHTFGAMLGYSWQHFYSSDYSRTLSNTDPNFEIGTSLPNKEGWIKNEELGIYEKEGSRRIPTENYLVSFFGRVNYTYDERFLATFTLRQDGSSRFSEDNRWGTFPSVAVAWTITQEEFMQNQDILSTLKLRGGYGITGQQDINNNYAYIPTYIFGSNPNTDYFGSNGLLRPGAYNRNLKWEETATTNVAIDYGFLNNRIYGSIEYYDKNTKDLISEVDVASGTNFTNRMTMNVGEMENRGVEFNINTLAISTTDFSWTLGMNLTWNESNITKLTQGNTPDYPGISVGGVSTGTGTTIQKHQVGYTPFTFYTYQQVYDNNGKPMQNLLVDRNNDGELTEADRYLSKHSPMPKVFGGLSSEMTYKNFDLGFNIRASFGNYVFNEYAATNSTTQDAYGAQGSISNISSVVYDTEFTGNNSLPQVLSDHFLENASFLKMDNITLGYNFNKLFTEDLSGRLSFSVQNVFTITEYSGLDPENSGIDSNIWPRPRTYTLGLNLNF